MFKFLKFTFLVYLLMALALAATGLVLWRTAGMRYDSVQTDSMAPLIRPGDFAISTRVNPVDLQAGDIVSYRSSQPGHTVVDHRVYRVFPTQGTLVTKGDNLNYPDPAISYGQVTGKTVTVVPYLGGVLDFIRSPAGLILTVYLPVLLITAYEFSRLAVHFTYRSYDANVSL